MGCVASRLEEEEEVVTICRERKRLIKLAVESRYALAEAHCRYCQSLYAVSAAIKLFVARHSSPSLPFLITFPSPSTTPPLHQQNDDQNVVFNPSSMFLQQKPSESTHEAIRSRSCDSSTTSSESSDEETHQAHPQHHQQHQEHHQRQQVLQQQQQHEQVQASCGYYYMQMPAPMASPQRNFGWDFFDPFNGMRPEVFSSYQRNMDDEMRTVREQEGIPDLEEDGYNNRQDELNNKTVAVEENGGAGGGTGSRENRDEEETSTEMEKVVHQSNLSSTQTDQKGFSVIDTPENGRELLDALKDIEDLFIRAYDSGKDVSRMLEASLTHLHSGLEEIKENSTKLIQSITWNRSGILKPSSCKSLVASSSRNTSVCTEYGDDLFNKYGGMVSGSHSLTLGRLYAWEKKLYEEVKAGDDTRKLYERKCLRLKNQDAKGFGGLTVDKSRVAVKDLYARILVAIRSAESISKRIQTLTDEELQPQIVELLKGLALTWKSMLESHETQNKILHDVRSFACPTYGKFCNESHRLATLQLEVEVRNWRECFTGYVTAQKTYVEALHGWLTKFLVPEVEFYSRVRGSGTTCQVNGPPLLMICQDWLNSLDKLPNKGVTFALKSFSKDVKVLWSKQGEEQQQKRKVDSLAKELDRRTLAFQKAETRFLESKISDKSELEIENSSDNMMEKKDQLDLFTRKLEVEREKHQSYMQETQRITFHGFQSGFSTVFNSLTEFCEASINMYNELVTYSDNAEKANNQSRIQGCEVEESDSR